RLVAEVAALRQQGHSDRAVEQAAVQHRQAVSRAQLRGDGPLPRRRGSIDGDDEAAHPISAPNPAISSPKPGKLVAIMPGSSTATGCSAPRPGGRAVIAMGGAP